MIYSSCDITWSEGVSNISGSPDTDTWSLPGLRAGCPSVDHTQSPRPPRVLTYRQYWEHLRKHIKDPDSPWWTWPLLCIVKDWSPLLSAAWPCSVPSMAQIKTDKHNESRIVLNPAPSHTAFSSTWSPSRSLHPTGSPILFPGEPAGALGCVVLWSLDGGPGRWASFLRGEREIYSGCWSESSSSVKRF